MKKRNSLSLLLLLLVFVSGAFVVGTYAKYVSTVNGSGTATVAKWNFATDNEVVDFTVNLAEKYDASTLVDGKIAPGTEGSFDIKLVNTSDVAANVEVALDEIDNVPTNLKFYSNEEMTDELVPGEGTMTGVIKAGDATGMTAKIYWKWAYESSTGEPASIANGDAADTADGEEPATLTIGVTVTGTQVAPSTTPVTTGWN